ncbi:MAG: 5'-nucleotidase [Mariniphaga sp.]
MQFLSTFKRIQFRSRLAVILALLTFLNIACHSLIVTKVESGNIRLDSTLNVVPDPKIESVILPYRIIMQREIKEVLCSAKVSLYSGHPESPLTNFCADLLRNESDSICLKQFPSIHIDIAMLNRGGLRVPIPKGEVKIQDMFELMPFENKVVFLKLSGSDLRRYIDHMASRGGEGVSGMKFGIKEKKGVNPEINGKPLDDSKTYWLATIDYLANGGDGNLILKGIHERVTSEVKIRDMFINHLRNLGRRNIVIEANNDGRIYDAK